MDCKKVEKAFIECDIDNLPEDVRLHCWDCEECGRKLRSLKRDFAILEQMKEIDCDIDVTEAVMAQINEKKHWYRGHVAQFALLTLVAASVALFLIFNIDNTSERRTNNLVAVNTQNEDAIIDEMLIEVYLTTEAEVTEEEAIFEAYYGMYK